MLLYLVVQEQLCEREQTIHELERKMEEKERELHAIKLDNEAVSGFGCVLPLFYCIHLMLISFF